MTMQAALPADIAVACASRPFCTVGNRQVRTFDDTGVAAEVSDLDLHKDFMQAADRAFLPAPTPAPAAGMDFA